VNLNQMVETFEKYPLETALMVSW